MQATKNEAVHTKMVSLLRGLAVIVLFFGLVITGLSTAGAVAGNSGAETAARNCLGGVQITLCLSAVLYGLSYIAQVTGDIGAVLGTTIVALLRYVAVASVVLFVPKLILLIIYHGTSAEAVVFVKSIIITFCFVVILYVLSSLISIRTSNSSTLEKRSALKKTEK